MTGHIKTLQPEGWPRPKGYSNGIVATGRTVFVAGQVGWDEREQMVGEDFVSQFGQALRNIVAVLKTAGGGPSDIVRLTIFTCDIDGYQNHLKEVGAVYREVIGKHYPVMSLIGIAALIEPGAVVEVEATAVLAD